MLKTALMESTGDDGGPLEVIAHGLIEKLRVSRSRG
jgi:hypothetical protein